MPNHLVFFDDQCPFCHKQVSRLIEIDTHKRLKFAPLNGKTAADILSGPPAKLKNMNSVVLVENYDSTERNFWVRAKAIFRVHWLIGNGWGLIGIFSFLPSFLIDPFYRWYAEHRHQYKLKMPDSPGPKDRFLP
jgi:predicted DCC family thiol-disulfide oxidoreductase YuxK